MKNVLKGGLMSLIPNREIKDADEMMDELDEQTVEVVKEDPAPAPKKKLVEAKAKAKVKEKDEAKVIPAKAKIKVKAEVIEDDGVQEVVPSAPNVTPLTIDIEPEEMDKETLTPKHKKKEEPVAQEESSSEMWDQHEDDVLNVPIDEIVINPNQPRRKFEVVEMQELTDSIAQHGILQPLVVSREDEGYELIAGERRLRAAKSLKWAKVPVVVRRDVHSGSSRLELALIENIQRQDLNSVEEAMAYRQLNEEYGMTHEEIGERVGKSRVGITNSIRVLQLPEEIQRGVIDGKISAGHARAILMIPDDGKQVRFYRHLVEEGLTVRKAETRARRIQRTMNIEDPMRHKRKGRTAYEIKHGGLLEDRFGFDAKVKFNEERNRFEVWFKCHSQEEIEVLVDRLLGKSELPENEDKDVIDK